MTHYKKHWLTLLSERLNQGKRVIIKKELYPSFLCHCITSLGRDFKINEIDSQQSMIITKE